MTTDRPLRAALYARVSTIGHGQDAGLQLDELRQVAAQRGWAIHGEHVDEGVSGIKDSRPALDLMLADARAGKLDVIAVWRLDRLGRDLRHLLAVCEDLASWGVGLVSLRDAGFDTTSAQGKLLLARKLHEYKTAKPEFPYNSGCLHQNEREASPCQIVPLRS